MLHLKSKWLALLAGALLAASPMLAQDSGPLIDLLVKKGIVTDQEAEELRADLVKDFAANTSAGKLNLSSAMSEFKISGDVRLRHQYEVQAPETATGTAAVSNERTRERFRFRLNGDIALQKGWYTGFALESGQAADSGNQTFQSANDDYAIFLARAFIGWQVNPNLGFVIGKQKNPLYTTDLVWDADINPQGASEIYKAFLNGKDTFEVRALQDIMEDRNESTAGPLGRDAWLFAQQAVYTHWFGTESLNSVILAPGFMKYNQSSIGNVSGSVVGTNGAAIAGGAINAQNENPFNGSTRGLSILTFAGEVNWMNVNGAGTSVKLYWDSAYNTEAGTRLRAYGLSPSAWDKDALAWLAGVGYGYGTGKVQGDYSIKLDYRQIGLGSVDPNLNDSDFAFGKLNQQGWKLATSYNLADFISLNATYFYTQAIQDKLTNAVANLDHSQLLQLDVVLKF